VVPGFIRKWENDMLCCHCQKKKQNRPRGLCWTCYYGPGIRALHPSSSKFARHGILDKNGGVPLPHRPTAAVPGSEAKIQVLMERAQLQQALFHPEDGDLPRPRVAGRVFRLCVA
jgi:hypothetical protein